LGQFNQQGRDGFVNLLEGLKTYRGDGGKPGAGQNLVQTVHARERVFFVRAKVTQRMKGNRRKVSAISVDAQHRLLSHDPGRHENGRFFAENGGNFTLEFLHHPASAIEVHDRVVGDLSQQRRDTPWSVTAEKASALLRKVVERNRLLPSHGRRLDLDVRDFPNKLGHRYCGIRFLRAI
jgi:hypothetical protein